MKTRLAATFLIIIIVPMMLFYLMTVMLSNYQVKSFIKEYDLLESVDFFSGNSMQVPNRLTKRFQEGIRKTLDKNPGLYSNKKYLGTINAELKNHYTCLTVIREDAIIYYGDNNTTGDEALCAQLPRFGAMKSETDGGIYLDGSVYLDGENQHLVKRTDFDFPDGEAGSAFIISNVGDLMPEAKSTLRGTLILGAMTLVIAEIALTLWVYRSIFNPLNKLQGATKEIRDGNLEFTLEVDADDEIGQLCQDFEEVCIRLGKNAGGEVQYDKDNKELTSDISHDLKTPIAAIKRYVEGIMDDVVPSPERLGKYVRTIHNKVNDMNRPIDEPTFYSKIDTNKIPYIFSKISVVRYFKDYVDEVGLNMEIRRIELGHFNYVDEGVVVVADTEQMKRVINSIISNSMKYLDKKKGIINTRIKDMGDFIQAEIEDNGKGIVAKGTPNIFDRFYRTGSSRNSSQGGSGISLPIMRKIIEDHRGRTQATSKKGIGMEIHFALRRYQEIIQGE